MSAQNPQSRRGRIIIVQQAVPTYRVDFFEKLSIAYGPNFEVYGSKADLGVLTGSRRLRPWEKRLGDCARFFPGLEWQRGAAKLLLRKSDILVISGAPRCVTNMVLLAKARLLGVKTVWWGHLWSSTSRWWRYLIRLGLMRMSDVLLFYTDMEVEEYKRLRFAKNGVFALNNGLSLTEIRKVRVDYRAAKRGRSVLFVGRLTEKSQLSLMLRALSFASLADVHLEVIGGGPAESDFRKLASDLGVKDKVFWHGATIDESQIARVANRCLLFVYPGAVGLSLIHAMGYGLPAILHNDRSTHGPEIAAFEEGVTGRSFDKGDSEQLALRIAEALSHPESMENWSRNAQDLVDESFNTASMATRFIEMVNWIDRRGNGRR